MRIEIKIGDLRISAEGRAVRFHCPDLTVSAEQAELIARLLTLLSESLSTPSLPQDSSSPAELAPAVQVSSAAAQATIATPIAAPRFAVRSAVSAPASVPVASAAAADAAIAQVEQPSPEPSPRIAVRTAVSTPASAPVASAAVAIDSVPQIDLASQAATPRFAIRTAAAATTVSGASATRVPSRMASATPSATAAGSEAPAAPSSTGPTRRILGTAPTAPAAPPTPELVAAHVPEEAAAAEGMAAEAAAAELEAPSAAPQAPAAVRRVIAPKAEASSEAASNLSDSGAAAHVAIPPRRVLRPSTPADGSAETVAAAAPAAKTEGEGAPRRVLRPVGTPGAADAALNSPMPSPAASQRVVRPTAASELTPDIIPAEPALRRSMRPTGAQEVPVEAGQVEADSADRRPGRPRQTPLNGQVSEAITAAPAETQKELQVRRKPGRPLGSRNRVTSETAPAQAPGRPRKSPLTTPAAELAQVAAAPTAKASEPPLTESPAAAADSQGESKGRTMRLVDHLDQWMRENPGPKTREQLLDISIANSWVAGPDAGRIFSMCMNREKNLFTRMPDGNTEIYLRRAELAPPNTPGKLIRRPGTGKPTA